MSSNTSRRGFLTATGAIIAGAGCLSSPLRNGADIVVENADSDSHSHRVVVSTAGGNFSPRAETDRIWSDSDRGPTTVTFENMVPILDFAHTFSIEIALNGEMVYTGSFEGPLEEYRFTIRGGAVTTEQETVTDE